MLSGGGGPFLATDRYPQTFVMPEQQSQGDWPLSQDEYARYGRQMIMPEWGLPGVFCDEHD